MSYNVLRVTRACMLASIAGVAVGYASGPASAQVKDPGPRPLTAAQAANNTQPKTAPSLNGFQGITFDALTTTFFNAVVDRFQEVDSVSGTVTSPFPEPGGGLGPRFNSNSCASCHVFPILGAGSPPANFTTTDASGRSFTGNPQVTVANIDGATNVVPSFVTANGPVREARFVFNPGTTTLDGGVHDLFTITGRVDAQGCKIAQPNFAQQLAATNVIFRIPITVNGDGLVDVVPDGDQNTSIGLVGAANAQASLRASLGIGGLFNRSGNDGTITKFGWKAQNKSLLIFSGEAYNVEQGVTNELFPNERDDTAGCQANALPEDHTNLTPVANSGSNAADFSADIIAFGAFMRLSSPLLPATPFNASQSRGQTVFFNIGCGACHIQNQTTTTLSFTNTTTAQGPVTFQPFSDFQTHGMGGGLADGIFQGNADGDHFRSAPLWGVGQRIFFLHDGRTSDLLQAIEQHVAPTPSPATNAVTATAQADVDNDISRSEASQVIRNFNALSPTDQQNVLNFLRAL